MSQAIAAKPKAGLLFSVRYYLWCFVYAIYGIALTALIIFAVVSYAIPALLGI